MSSNFDKYFSIKPGSKSLPLVLLITSAVLALIGQDAENEFLVFFSLLLGGACLSSFAYYRQSKRLKTELGESEKENLLLIDRYHVLTENLAAAVIIRGAQGETLYCSPYTVNLTGYPLEEIYQHEGDFFLSIIYPDDLEAYLSERKFSRLGEPYQCRYRIFNRQNLEIWIDARSVPIFNEKGSVISSLTIAFDVTGAVRKEQQIEEKNRDLSDFTYMVSHDLKSPIHTIQGMLNIIKEDHQENLGPELQEILHHVSDSAVRLEELVASVLEYARVTNEELKIVPVNLNSVLESISRDFGLSLEEASASLKIDSDVPEVMGNVTQIYQIFSNLISNAIKYRDVNRELGIKIYLAEPRGDREICVAVADNGQGIPKDQEEKIFRPFQRAHGKEIEGSGIGLACVKRLLEKIGGDIQLESEHGRGSIFLVYLKKKLAT